MKELWSIPGTNEYAQLIDPECLTWVCYSGTSKIKGYYKGALSRVYFIRLGYRYLTCL